MNLDELTKLEAAMTPGPWAEDPRCEGIIGGDNRSLLRADSDGYAECWREEDTAGIVALRNAAPALIECASLLHRIVYGDTPLADIAKARAALARLEK
jgi:hypothetical protein